MEVIIDTNILMDAIFNQPENEDCWEILHLIRKKDIVPVMCEGLHREYIFAPNKIIFRKLANKLILGELTADDFKDAEQACYECSTTLAKILTDNSKTYKTVSKYKISTDPDDDKIINLAYDANCTIIITKNMAHFECVEENHFKAKNGKAIEVYTPDQFVSNFRIIKHSREGKFHNQQNRRF